MPNVPGNPFPDPRLRNSGPFAWRGVQAQPDRRGGACSLLDFGVAGIESKSAVRTAEVLGDIAPMAALTLLEFGLVVRAAGGVAAASEVSAHGQHPSQWTREATKLLAAGEHNTDHLLFLLGVAGEMARKLLEEERKAHGFRNAGRRISGNP
jgi:hypothetical protein